MMIGGGGNGPMTLIGFGMGLGYSGGSWRFDGGGGVAMSHCCLAVLVIGLLANASDRGHFFTRGAGFGSAGAGGDVVHRVMFLWLAWAPYGICRVVLLVDINDRYR